MGFGLGGLTPLKYQYDPLQPIQTSAVNRAITIPSSNNRGGQGVQFAVGNYNGQFNNPVTADTFTRRYQQANKSSSDQLESGSAVQGIESKSLNTSTNGNRNSSFLSSNGNSAATLGQADAITQHYANQFGAFGQAVQANNNFSALSSQGQFNIALDPLGKFLNTVYTDGGANVIDQTLDLTARQFRQTDALLNRSTLGGLPSQFEASQPSAVDADLQSLDTTNPFLNKAQSAQPIFLNDSNTLQDQTRQFDRNVERVQEISAQNTSDRLAGLEAATFNASAFRTSSLSANEISNPLLRALNQRLDAVQVSGIDGLNAENSRNLAAVQAGHDVSHTERTLENLAVLKNAQANAMIQSQPMDAVMVRVMRGEVPAAFVPTQGNMGGSTSFSGGGQSHLDLSFQSDANEKKGKGSFYAPLFSNSNSAGGEARQQQRRRPFSRSA